MKILYIITQADGGGAQKYVLQLAKHFGGAIAAGDEAAKLFEEAQKAGLTVFKLKHLKRNINPWHDLLAVWEIGQLINFYKPDIVHLNSSKAGVLGSFAGIGKKTKVIFTAHGFVFNEPLSKPVKALYLSLEKIASDFRDMIIAVSERDRQSALRHNLIDPEKIVTIYNGIPPVDFLPRDDARTRLNISSDRFIFGTIANFYKSKGLDILIDAVAKMDRKLLEKAQFVIVGSGPELLNLKSKILNLKLDKNFLLLGQVPNASTYLKAFDVFILPSRKEGLPYTLLEAMQAGLPIVATDVGGIREALDDTETILPPGDVDLLATTLSAMITDYAIKKDTELSRTLSEASLVRAKEFTEERMLKETERIYKLVVSS